MAIEDPAPRLRAALASLRAYHRWLTLSGVQRDQARGFLGAANLVFLGLILTGAVLWWPRILRWPWLRQQLTWRPAPPTAKARDLRLHHIIGAWAFLPLLIICASGTVFYYRWANDAVYALAGETAPVRALPPTLPATHSPQGPSRNAFCPAPRGPHRVCGTGLDPAHRDPRGRGERTPPFFRRQKRRGPPQAVTTVTVFEDGRVETATFTTLSAGQRARRPSPLSSYRGSPRDRRASTCDRGLHRRGHHGVVRLSAQYPPAHPYALATAPAGRKGRGASENQAMVCVPRRATAAAYSRRSRAPPPPQAPHP